MFSLPWTDKHVLEVNFRDLAHITKAIFTWACYYQTITIKNTPKINLPTFKKKGKQRISRYYIDS